MSRLYTSNSNGLLTDMGLYSYNNSKPHAVDYILPPDNMPEREQYIKYNDWSKATDVYYYVGDDFYHLGSLTAMYNRYSYCLNNPLKYTDPSGNNFAETLLTGVIDLFTTAFFKGGLDITSVKNIKQALKEFDPTASWSKTNKSWQMSKGFYDIIDMPALGFINTLYDTYYQIARRLILGK